MRRHIPCTSLLLLGASLLAGCGQKGPLVLPPPRPVVAPPSAPAGSAAQPAVASSVAAPAASSGGD